MEEFELHVDESIEEIVVAVIVDAVNITASFQLQTPEGTDTRMKISN